MIAWPRRGPNLSALIEDTDLPLPNGCIDRVIIVHGLEVGESVRPLLREIWRVLAPGGRVLIVAPNRRSLWAQLETTPFGIGRPFTRRQLMRLLRDQMFTPTQGMRPCISGQYASLIFCDGHPCLIDWARGGYQVLRGCIWWKHQSRSMAWSKARQPGSGAGFQRLSRNRQTQWTRYVCLKHPKWISARRLLRFRPNRPGTLYERFNC